MSKKKDNGMKVQVNIRCWAHVQMFDSNDPEKGYGRFDIPLVNKSLRDAIEAALADPMRVTVSRADGSKTPYAFCDVDAKGEVTLPLPDGSKASIGKLAEGGGYEKPSSDEEEPHGHA